jgi:hypothetical protein
LGSFVLAQLKHAADQRSFQLNQQLDFYSLRKKVRIPIAYSKNQTKPTPGYGMITQAFADEFGVFFSIAASVKGNFDAQK